MKIWFLKILLPPDIPKGAEINVYCTYAACVSTEFFWDEFGLCGLTTVVGVPGLGHPGPRTPTSRLRSTAIDVMLAVRDGQDRVPPHY